MTTSIIVLSAGASARMGRPKSLLDFDGHTALSLVMEACRHSHARETVLVLGTGGSAGREKQEAGAGSHEQELKIVTNEHPERGRTSSIKAGLEAISPRSEGFMLLPVDLPLVRAQDIDALIDRQEAAPRGRTIFVVTHEGRRGHPVLFADRHRETILALADDEPLHDYVRVREGETEHVEVGNEGVVAPMNTPDEYEHLVALFRARRAELEDAHGAAR